MMQSARLISHGITSIEQLRLMSDEELLSIYNFGRACLNDVHVLLGKAEPRNIPKRPGGRVDIKQDCNAAYAAAQWASGISQKEIAEQFGLNGSPPVNVAIQRFIKKYVPGLEIDQNTRTIRATGIDRMALVKPAIAAFCAAQEKRTSTAGT